MGPDALALEDQTAADALVEVVFDAEWKVGYILAKSWWRALLKRR